MKKNYLYLVLLTFFSVIGSKLLTFALSFHILNITGSPKYFSYLVVIYSVLFIVGSPIAGFFIDKLPRKLLITSFQLLTIITIIAYSIIDQSLNNLVYIYILVIILNITDIVVSLSFNSGLLELVGEKYIDKTVSHRSAIQNGVQIGSPILGGLIYAIMPVQNFIIIMLVTETITLVLALLLTYKNKEIEALEKSKGESFIQSYKTVWNFVKRKKDILLVVASGIIINFLFAFITLGIPASFVTYFDMGSKELGFLEATFPTAGFLFAIIYPYFKKKGGIILNVQLAYLIISIGTLIICLPFVFMFKDLIILVVYMCGMFLIGIGVMLSNIPINIYVQKQVPEEIKAKYFATQQTLSQITMPLGILIAGALFDSNTGFYLISFTVFMITCLILVFVYQHLKRYV
ncbi:MFS transporter [Mammaliicoccus fleurettii]|uniref:MFS transporter n=1 Tax=Mammaliicoccus fleurettii TaxID=150056 RepID=UPI002DBD698D|nr:MFS transporter [Mammaliicoccus fleurettii]MEB7725456.1 MFS transporter [Mammaliicoccus fleurettii]